ncbi:MAG TPA: outer membrane beta-barrel protein [Burkholderiales bacterium]|nr:outer membrane beta-barrel protein [Burkholderiales bacterium]
MAGHEDHRSRISARRLFAQRSLAWTCAALAVFAACSTAAIGAETAEVPPGRLEDERPRPLPEGAPPLALSTDFGHPALGLATYVPAGHVFARGIRVEPFTIRAAVQAGMGYNDNVTLSNANKVGSFFTSVSPSVSVGLEGATQRYYAVYRGNYGAYASSAQDDYADHNLALNATHLWTTRFRTFLNYEYLKAHTPLGLTSTSLGRSERWSWQSVRGAAQYGTDGAQGRLHGEVGHSERRVSGSTSTTADYERTDAIGTFFYRLAPKTRGFVQLGWGDITHPRDPTLDNIEYRYSLGVTWEALAKTTGRLSAGYTTKDFSAGTRADFSGYHYELGVNWRPYEQTGTEQPAVDLSVRRFTSESYEVGSNLVVYNVATVAWTHLWAHRILSTLQYAYGRVELEGLARTDTYKNAAARISYPLRRSIRVGAELRHDARSSDAALLDYTRNIMLLTLEAAL